MAPYFMESERLCFREVRVSDVNETYYRWLNNPEVNRYLETRFIPQSYESITYYVKQMDGNKNELFFAICLRESDEHIGNIKIGPINWYHRTADISLLIGEKQYWGKGYASEAIRAVSAVGFKLLNLRKLKAGCYADNLGSACAFKKAGYTQEALLKKQVLIDLREEDVILLGFHVDDFRRQT